MPRLALFALASLTLTACMSAIDGGRNFATASKGVAMLEKYCLPHAKNLSGAETALIRDRARKTYDKQGRYGRTAEYYLDRQKVGIEMRFTKVPRCQARFMVREDPASLRKAFDVLPNYSAVSGSQTRMTHANGVTHSLTSKYAHRSGSHSFSISDGFSARGKIGNGVELTLIK